MTDHTEFEALLGASALANIEAIKAEKIHNDAHDAMAAASKRALLARKALDDWVSAELSARGETS